MVTTATGHNHSISRYGSPASAIPIVQGASLGAGSGGTVNAPCASRGSDAYAIGAGSQRRLWWRCRHGHEWQTTVNTRSRGCGCPTCATQRPRPRTTAGRTPSSRSTRFSLADCLEALAEFILTFGEAPTVARYQEFAAWADGRLPSPRTIRTHTTSIGGWRDAIHRAAAIAKTSEHSRSSAR
jgi:hypothetical protein